MHNIDSHKLHLHPRVVADWLDGKSVSPIYLEVSPAGSCNHRCIFCGMRYLGYKPNFLPTDAFCMAMRSMGAAGVKAIMFAGEGEPLLHKNIIRFAQEARSADIDVAFTTNGVLLTPDKAAALLPVTSWIKISCNAGTPAGYRSIHAASERDFEHLVSNVKNAVRIRRDRKSNCSIGLQLLIIKENINEILPFCRLAASLGVDYAVLKPYSSNEHINDDAIENLDLEACKKLKPQWEALERNDFRILFREQTLLRIAEKAPPYPHCTALPFWGYVDSTGTLWGCLRHIGDVRFEHGNVLGRDFADLAHGPARLQNIQYCERELDISLCHRGCRMDAINRYLHTLRNPGAHKNFI